MEMHTFFIFYDVYVLWNKSTSMQSMLEHLKHTSMHLHWLQILCGLVFVWILIGLDVLGKY